jgi:hypothetical protein
MRQSNTVAYRLEQHREAYCCASECGRKRIVSAIFVPAHPEKPDLIGLIASFFALLAYDISIVRQGLAP